MTYTISMTPEEYQNAIEYLYKGTKSVQVMVTPPSEEAANVMTAVLQSYRARHGQPNYQR